MDDMLNTIEQLSILAQDMMDDCAAKGEWNLYEDAMEAYQYCETLKAIYLKENKGMMG